MSLNAARDGELLDSRGAPLVAPGADAIRPLGDHKCYHLEVCIPGGPRHYYVPDPAIYEGCSAGRVGEIVQASHLYQWQDGKLIFDEYLTFISVPIIYSIVDEPMWWLQVEKKEKKFKAKEEK